jgi:hypothetical protein
MGSGRYKLIRRLHLSLSMMVPWVSAKPRHSLTLSGLRCLGLAYFGYGPMA